MKRAPHTGQPAVTYDDHDQQPIDEATKAKRQNYNLKSLCSKSFGIDIGKKYQIAYDTKDLTDKNDWIAIIHADGNGLGRIVQQVGRDKDKYKEFSSNLNKATECAAQKAFEAVEPFLQSRQCIPIRPVVLGGDDMTVIIRGSLGIEYAKNYLRAFENNTKKKLAGLLPNGTDHLTACAGIAFIKSSYPFYYGYNLAEELCDEAKKMSGRMESCLLFHKVQDSFVTSYEDIVARELTVNGKPLLKFGPYYLNTHDDYMSVEELQELCRKLDEVDNQGIKTGIRRWLTALHENNGDAKKLLDRMKDVHNNNKLISSITDERHGAVPAADVLSLYTIMNQKTR